jgi:nucleoid-associated protein YgaU
MGRLGVVAIPGGRWRAYAGPAALLVAVTVTVALLRGGLRSSDHHAAPPRPAVHAALKPSARQVHRTYVVRAGDTIEAISTRTGVPQARILSLNPKVSPTALFIGERLRLS